MATKTFSGRAEEDLLSYADSLTQSEYGMSFGQYCASILLKQVRMQHALPKIESENQQQRERIEALQRMRVMSERLRGSKLAIMSDEEIKAQIASRYA